LEDYYAILGVDHEASPASIKLAYRRMAREKHPDRNLNFTETEKRVLSLHMAQLNGAYAVLSDATKRREYDEKLRIMDTLYGKTASHATATVTVTKSATVTKSGTKSNSSERVQPSHDADLILMRDLSKHIRSTLLANQKDFSWKETVLEGFDWGLECVSWATHYCVAGRAFAVLDPAAAKKFANYSEVVLTQCARSLRKSHFLFLIPFQQVSQWESVSAVFNRLCSPENRETRVGGPVGIVLFDVRRVRTLRVGRQLKEKPFEEVLLCLGPELMNSR
jgi:DnaJ domain